ncbi:MAG: glycosyltransferase family 2 protein [Chloroflexi bacterium]|nr:glycosyltransferase family 2 protein [Chloroflexota bacterium]
MNTNNNYTFSIVIPTRNENKDIVNTLDKCLLLNPSPLEILIVDDSTDNTPLIVGNYHDQRIRLIHRSENSNGCCGARNLGLSEAKGSIVVFLNADDRPETNFLNQLLQRYKLGADYIIVKSSVINNENLWGNFIYSTNELWLSTSPNMEWSEGFSCLKDKAMDIGGIPGDYCIPFCRDWMLGNSLGKAGCNKIVDLTISMPHFAPDNLIEYWHNQKWRGTFAPLNQFFIRKSSVIWTITREFLKLGRTFLELSLVVPQIINTIRIAKYSKKKFYDIPSIWFVSIIQKIAITVGNFKGISLLIQKSLKTNYLTSEKVKSSKSR